MAGAFAPALAWLQRATELALAFLPVGELLLGFLFRTPSDLLDGGLIASRDLLQVGDGRNDLTSPYWSE